MRRGVLRPDSIGVVGGVEDPAPERLVIRRRREQELRALHVERSTLDDRAAGRAEDPGQAALLERRRDDGEVLDEAVVEREQACVVGPVPSTTSSSRTGV